MHSSHRSSTCASTASDCGSQNLISIAWYKAMAADAGHPSMLQPMDSLTIAAPNVIALNFP
jgi:hypothetical protein